MNKKIRELLEKYNSELFKVGVNPKQREDNCGQVGLMGIEDQKNQLAHISWMIREMLDSWPDEQSDIKINRWLGFIQGVLWCAKFRGILELRNESKDLYNG